MLCKLQGAYAVVVLHATEEAAYCARLSSPLCIGVAEDERFLSSDPVAFRKYTDKVSNRLLLCANPPSSPPLPHR